MMNVRLLRKSWMDKRLVNMLTNCHRNVNVDTGKRDKKGNPKIKPACIADYNQNMGGVDKSDMMLSSVECVRKTVKWYKKLFFHLLDLALLNSYIAWVIVTKKNVGLAKYQLELCRQMLEKFGTASGHEGGGNRSKHAQPGRLIGRHFPGLIEKTETNRKGMKQCVQCSVHKKRKETRYMCSTCSVPLCVVPCLDNYHT